MDSGFLGGWSIEVGEDADTVMSRTGMVIVYANCTVNRRSLLQTELTISTSEAEYIAVSSA